MHLSGVAARSQISAQAIDSQQQIIKACAVITVKYNKYWAHANAAESTDKLDNTRKDAAAISHGPPPALRIQ